MRGGRVRTVGLLGGSFNPAHGGHRAVSLRVLAALGLDEVWWLVSPGNPLKDAGDMASLAARHASAIDMARRSRIRPTAIEAQLGIRYTIDTLRAIRARYPRIRFLWLMGADNLAQFDRWRDWRRIAATMPIAVVARPGYDRLAGGTVATAWLRRFVRPAGQGTGWTRWRPPALVLLRFRPDPRSSTALRRDRLRWDLARSTSHGRDAVTHRPLPV